MTKKARRNKKNNRISIRNEIKSYNKYVVVETRDETCRPNEYWVVGSARTYASANQMAEAYVNTEASKYEASVFRQESPEYTCLTIERQMGAAYNYEYMVLTSIEVMSKRKFAQHLKWLYDHGYRD